MKFSVVVCVKNEEKRILQCLRSIKKNKPSEIIVVDGNSKDKTIKLAKTITKKVYIRKNSNLTNDRQFGIDKCKNELIAMIDADHILRENDILNLINEMNFFKFDMIQSQLEIYRKNSLLNIAENQTYDVVHNIPGKKKMIGVAPAIYKKKIFKKVVFDDYITETIEDADFIYKLRKKNFNFGIGKVKIFQDHNGNLKAYIKKFMWYGKGDGEFIRKNPSQTLNTFYHLFIRYNFIYTLKSLYVLNFLAIPFFWIQSIIRIYAMFKYLFLFNNSNRT